MMHLFLRLRSRVFVAALIGLSGLIWGTTARAQCVFKRGDINNDFLHVVDLNDAVDLLAYLFIGESVPICYDAADANDNGLVELSDYYYLTKFFFEGGPPPPPPFPEFGEDPTPGTTVPSDRDPRFKFTIGEAIGFASNTGLLIPLYISNEIPIGGFQMVFQYDGDLLRIDEMLPDETALKDANAEYIIHQAFNKPGVTYGGFSTLIDFATPIEYRVLPAGENQLVGNIMMSVSLTADPGETPLEFVDGIRFPDEDDPVEKLAPLHNLVVVDTDVLRPEFGNGKVFIRKAFIRGDANQDWRTDISDPIYMLNYVFLGGPAPECMDAADVNNDFKMDISDPIFLLNYLFIGGPQPSSPFPIPGVDPDHLNLGCEAGI